MSNCVNCTRSSTQHNHRAMVRGPPSCVAFYSNQLGVRGTEVSLFDYADYAEPFIGRPLILYEKDNSNNADVAIRKFEQRFGKDHVIGVGWPKPPSLWDRVMGWIGSHTHATPTLDEVLLDAQVRELYLQKAGDNDGRLSHLPQVRNLVHAVFWAKQPHGDVYARISPTVPSSMNHPVVPYIVRPGAPHGTSLRAALRIPPNATVFCRHGGATTFDIGYVQRAICAFAHGHPRTFFLFMNTQPFCTSPRPANVLHVPPSSSAERKARFIRSCDAMIHARAAGESFGLAVAEFSTHHKPVITSSVVIDPLTQLAGGADTMHLQVLGDRALTYHDTPSLLARLTTFDRLEAARRGAAWNAYARFAPAIVMHAFWRAFFPNGSSCFQRTPDATPTATRAAVTRAATRAAKPTALPRKDVRKEASPPAANSVAAANAAAAAKAATPLRKPLLVALIGSMRGGETTWRSLVDNVLRPNGADLVLMIGRGSHPQRRTLLHDVAVRVWTVKERSDASWGVYVDELGTRLGAPNASAWRRDLGFFRVGGDTWMSPLFLGPWRWSATINLVLRWELKQRLLADSALLEGYRQFMITRTDQYFYCPLRLQQLGDTSRLWVPEGEDYGGVCDRLLICPREHLISALSIIDGYVVAPSRYPAYLNPERFFQRRLEQLLLWPHVRRFRRVMLTVTSRGDATRTRRPTMERLTANSSLSAKYPRELALARATCTRARELPSQDALL